MMKRHLTTAMLMASAMAVTSSPAFGQTAADGTTIVMRRPLPRVAGGSPTPTPPSTPDTKGMVFVAVGMCVNGSGMVQCAGIDPTAVDSAGLADVSSCIAQDPTDATYQAFSQMIGGAGGGILPPSEIAAYDGKPCIPKSSTTVYGATCEAQTPKCTKVDYDFEDLLDGPANAQVTSLEQVEWETCGQYGATPFSKTVLAGLGLKRGDRDPCLPDEPDAVLPALVAKGQCRTSVVYAPGWPQSGGAEVKTDFQLSCFAVSDWGTDNVSIQSTSEASCGQTATAAQQSIVDQVAAQTDYKDPRKIDRTCSSSGGVVVNYQRNDFPTYVNGGVPQFATPADATPTTVVKRPEDGQPYRLVGGSTVYQYVCTDLAAGTEGQKPPYFAKGGQEGSTYPATLSPCDAQRAQDVAELRAGRSVYGYMPQFDPVTDCQRNLPNDLLQLGTQCVYKVEDNGTDGIRITQRTWMGDPW